MWYRVFASQLIELSPTVLVETIQERGFTAEAHFRGDDLGWFGCEFRLGSTGGPIFLDRFLADADDIRDDLNTWAAWVEAQDYEPRRFALMERIVQSKQLFTLRKPIDHADEASLDRFCLLIVSLLAEASSGVYQIDGQGFFDAAGERLLEEY